MTYRKSDGPFGLLPKKTAMDHEWSASGRFLVPMRRHVGPEAQRSEEVERPRPRHGEDPPATPATRKPR